MSSQTVMNDVTAQFRALDLDGDGFITAADYHHAVDQLLAAFQVDRECPAAFDVRDLYLAVFDRLLARMGTRRAGRISEEEFRTSAECGAVPSPGRAMCPVAHALFTICDQDRDEFISGEELGRYVQAVGGAVAGVADILARYAANDRISRDTFVRMHEHPNADNPLSRIFG